MEIVTRFNQAWNSFYTTWQGINKPPGFFNPIYYSISSEEEERVKRYQKLQRYYDGEHEQFLKVQQGKPNDNVILNYSKRVVNKGAAYLFGKELGIDLVEYLDAPEEDILASVFQSDEKKQVFLMSMALTGATLGDFYIQIRIDEDGTPRPNLLNPLAVFPTFDSADYNKVLNYDIRWIENDVVWRIKHYPNTRGTWAVEYQYQEKDIWYTDTERSYTWEYDFPMIIKGCNLPKPNSPWGYADLEDADLNDYINLSASNMNKILRMFAHPIIWGRGYNLKEADSSQIFMSNDEKAHMSALELSQDLSSSENFVSSLKTTFSEVTSVPESDPEKLKIGAQSGFALNVLNNDLMLKTNLKRSTYGMIIKEFIEKAFFILGIDKPSVKLNWQNPLPLDMREQTDSHRFDIEAGLVSRKTLSAQRGYDYDEEQQRIEQERNIATSLGESLLQQFERGVNTQNA